MIRLWIIFSSTILSAKSDNFCDNLKNANITKNAVNSHVIIQTKVFILDKITMHILPGLWRRILERYRPISINKAMLRDATVHSLEDDAKTVEKYEAFLLPSCG
jgi:hypothetical protein